jgi:UDP-perosamine 4-acetyltransferase
MKREIMHSSERYYLTQPVLILGAGGHARVLIDALLASSAIIAGIVDPDPLMAGSTILAKVVQR